MSKYGTVEYKVMARIARKKKLFLFVMISAI